MHVCVHVLVCVCAYVCMYVYMCLCTLVCLLCVCACVCECARVYVYVFVCMCGVCVLYECTYVSMGMQMPTHTTLTSVFCLDWLTSDFQGSFCLCLPEPGLQAVAFYMGMGALNSVPYLSHCIIYLSSKHISTNLP